MTVSALDDMRWWDHRSALSWLGMLYRRPRILQGALAEMSRLSATRVGFLLVAHAVPWMISLKLVIAMVGGTRGPSIFETGFLDWFDGSFCVWCPENVIPQISFGIVGGIFFGAATAIAIGTSGAVTVGIVSGIFLGVLNGTADVTAGWTAGGIVGGIVFGIGFGIAGKLIDGSAGEIPRGIAFGIAVGIAGIIGFGISPGIALGIMHFTNTWRKILIAAKMCVRSLEECECPFLPAMDTS